MRLIGRPFGYRDNEQAFLAGSIHDVGEMILVDGDPRGFAQLGKDMQSASCQMIDKEQKYYEFDHTLIGMRLLDPWNLDAILAQGALNYHSNASQDNGNELAAMLAVADYLTANVDQGLFAEPPVPSPEILARVQCGGEEALTATP